MDLLLLIKRKEGISLEDESIANSDLVILEKTACSVVYEHLALGAEIDIGTGNDVGAKLGTQTVLEDTYAETYIGSEAALDVNVVDKVTCEIKGGASLTETKHDLGNEVKSTVADLHVATHTELPGGRLSEVESGNGSETIELQPAAIRVDSCSCLLYTSPSPRDS